MANNVGFIKAGKRVIAAGFVLFIAQNVYFGWNDIPMSEAERIVDSLTSILLQLGFILYIVPALNLYEKAVKKNDAG